MHPEDAKKKFHIYTENGQFVAAKLDQAEAMQSVKDRNERAADMGLSVRYELRNNPEYKAS